MQNTCMIIFRNYGRGDEVVNVNWLQEVEKRKQHIIQDTQEFLRINSVLDETTATETQPFGAGISKALLHMLNKGKEHQFYVKNIDGYAGVVEMGEGAESVGILCHIDVVPTGDGWVSAPFAAEIRENKIFARGAIDNKGPTMAAFWAMEIVKELQLPLHKRVRMILGTDEESNWRCVDHYFKHEEMPTLGFAPDADFPIIHAEKGITDVSFNWNNHEENDYSELTLISFQSGERFNMVPDKAVVSINGEEKQLVEMATKFNLYLQKNQHNGQVEQTGDLLHLIYEGVAAHGSTPENGLNAGVYLTKFLTQFVFQNSANAFLNFIVEHSDQQGNTLGIAVSDDVSGPLTVNLGLMQFKDKGEAQVGLNIRYPVTASFDDCFNQLNKKALEHQAIFTIHDHMEPNYVEKEHPLIQTLQSVYKRQTGEEPTLLAIGGGTYARSLSTGVAFGPMFPGREDVAHKKNEFIDIDDLLRMTALYAEAIYELAKDA